MAALRPDPVKEPARMKSYWKREWKAVLAVAFFGLLFDGCMTFGPILQGRLIDTIVSESPLSAVLLQAAAFLALILFVQIMRFFKRYFVRLFANRTSASMRLMLYNNLLHRDIAFLSQAKTGDLLTRAVSDVDICVEGMRKITTEVFDTGVLMLSYLISLFVYDWKITLAACAFVPVAMLLAEKLKKSIVRFSKAARSQSSHVAELTYDNVEHTVLLRVNGLEGQNQAAYFTALDDLEQKSIKANLLENSMQPVYQVIALLGIVFALYFGGQNVIGGGWTVGMFSAYISIFTALTLKASKAAKLFNSYQKAKVSWQRIKSYLTPHQEKDKTDRGIPKTHTIQIDKLRFAYPASQNTILNNITLSARTGEIIGVTGSVACGKTTLGVVLQGLYPYEGSILLDGAALSGYSDWEKSLRISYLGHHPELLSDTIYQNITLGDGGDILPVLNDVCFLEDLSTMPLGVDTVVGSSGVRLSGGQQARIALARALYRKSPVLILDDPFSAVDMRTEEAILQNLRTRYADRIIFLISHRLTAFPKTDRVLLLQKDGSGLCDTHEALLAASPLYRGIYTLQTGGNVT